LEKETVTEVNDEMIIGEINQEKRDQRGMGRVGLGNIDW
jgi:hypothetical protein